MEKLDLTQPRWLEAYPNKGSQDFFGFRFLRQSNRVLVLGPAAANQFKTAKTLLFFPSIAIEYRKQHGIENDTDLSATQITEWNKWFKIAYYLYTVNSALDHGNVPDAGFTGAITEARRIKELLNESGKKLDINTRFDVFYGKNNTRHYGYFTQFWIAPMRYYDSITSVAECKIGAYGKGAYELLSSNESWGALVNVLKSGVINIKTWDSIKEILESDTLTKKEMIYAQKMILDGDLVNKESAEYYNGSFTQFVKLLDDYHIKYSDDFSSALKVLSIYLYRYFAFTDNAYNDIEIRWRFLCSSFPFELGLVGLFQRAIIKYGVVVKEKDLKNQLDKDVKSWLKANGIQDGPIEYLAESYRKKFLTSAKELENKLSEIQDRENEYSWVGGFVLGLLIYYKDKEYSKTRERDSQAYEKLTQEYYEFNPQFAFRTIPDFRGTFAQVIRDFAFSMFERQYKFSLYRMGFGQDAKYIAFPHSEEKKFEFQVDADLVDEKEGILGFIDGTLRLWLTSGLIKVVEKDRLTGNKKA